MTRGASFHMKALTRPAASHAHNTRTWSEEHPAPGYLLPEEHSRGHERVIDIADVQATHAAKLAIASAKAKSLAKTGVYSPLYEGVLNLSHPTGHDPDPHHQRLDDPRGDQERYAGQVRWFAQRYEQITGHRVLAADIHLDEGRVEGGRPIYNAHAHVVIDRTDDRGRPIQLNKDQMRQIQDLAADVTGLERGTDARETKRRHLPHQHYRALAKRGAIRGNVELEHDIRQWESLGTITEIESAGRVEAEKKLLATLQKLEAERSKANQLDAVQKALELVQTDLDAARRQRDEANHQLRTVDRDRETAELYGELRGVMKASGQATQVNYVEARQRREDRAWLADQVETWSKRADAVREAQEAAKAATVRQAEEIERLEARVEAVRAGSQHQIASAITYDRATYESALNVAISAVLADEVETMRQDPARPGGWSIVVAEAMSPQRTDQLADSIFTADVRKVLGPMVAAYDRVYVERDAARAHVADLQAVILNLGRTQTWPNPAFPWGDAAAVKAQADKARSNPTPPRIQGRDTSGHGRG